MKRAEVIQLLKDGKTIDWVRWGNETYSIGYKTVNSSTVIYLLKKGLIKRFRNKEAPLTGFFEYVENPSISSEEKRK